MDELRETIRALVAAEQPMTVRQVFYRLVSAGLVKKTEGEYGSTVCRLLTEMRLEYEIPFGWIVDNTRWMRKPRSYSGLGEIVDSSWRTYRRALWDNQEAYVEVWCEKEALAGVIYDVTQEWDTPLMVTKGYASISFLYQAAQTIEAEDKPTYIYFFGDYDPSGLDIARQVEMRLCEFAYGSDITFERVAVTPEQVTLWNLPTRPTKRTDTRSNGWGGSSVELDAIPPSHLRNLVRERIEQHVDREAFTKLKLVEESERELLSRIIAKARPELDEANADAEDSL